MANKNKKTKKVGAFQTYALADDHTKDRATNATMPSDYAVKEARDWVNENQK